MKVLNHKDIEKLPFRTGRYALSKMKKLEKEMATHSRTLAWIIPWMEEPGRLQSMGSQSVGND